MSAPTFTYTAQMNTNVGTPNVVITDTTDYTGFDVTLMLAIIQENVNGTPFYQNINWTTPSWSSPDLKGSPSTLTFQHNLPFDINGVVPFGTYTFVVIPYYDGAAQASVTVTVPYLWSLPIPELNIGWSCEAGQLTASDNTDYSDVVGATLVSVVRTLTLTYPQGSGQSPIVTPNPLIIIGANTANQFWTGDYQLNLSSVVTYLVGTNTVVVTITGYKGSGTISCDSDLCGIRGCIYSVFQKWIGYCGTNAAQAEFYHNLYFQCEGYWADIIRSRECGLVEQIQKDFCKLKELLVGEKCGCPKPNSDSPIQIFPLNTVPLNCVVAAGTDISVSAVTVGNTTTYTVSVSAGLINTITTITGDITTINTTLASLQDQITALQGGSGSKYIKLNEQFANHVTSGTSITSLYTYTILKDTMADNDEIVFTGEIVNGTQSGSSFVFANTPGIVIFAFTGAYSYNIILNYASSIRMKLIKITIIKVSDTTIKIQADFVEQGGVTTTSISPLVTTSSLTTNDLIFTLKGTTPALASSMTLVTAKTEKLIA